MTDYVMVDLYKPRPIVSWKKLTDKIIVTKREHHMYKGWLHMRKVMPGYALMNPEPLIGKWHYVYRSEKGRISLVFLTDWLYQGHPWEICGGGFTEDIERYATKDDAEVRIKELLE